jgi:hypothetical protein
MVPRMLARMGERKQKNQNPGYAWDGRAGVRGDLSGWREGPDRLGIGSDGAHTSALKC